MALLNFVLCKSATKIYAEDTFNIGRYAEQQERLSGGDFDSHYLLYVMMFLSQDVAKDKVLEGRLLCGTSFGQEHTGFEQSKTGG